MSFSLFKAIKNTHRHPANKMLHAIGLFLYGIAILMIISSYLLKININYFTFVLLFVVAIALFLLGHNIEGNLRATTWVILFKYLQSQIKNKKRNQISDKHTEYNKKR